MRLPDPITLAQALSTHPLRSIGALPGRRNHLRAGILLPLQWHDDTIEVVATQRTSHLRDHAGEVVFPGGKPDPTDPDLTATALREAREELGIQGARVLGRLSAIPLFTSDFRLVPTVAQVTTDALVPNPDEVARVFRLDLRALLTADRLQAIAWPTETGFPPSPVFEMDGVDGPLMYGGTSICLYELLEVVARIVGRPLPPPDVSRWTWDMNAMGPARLPMRTAPPR